ncbi:MAG: RNA methyltransferase [Muribaculaceae bacterium]|nr:RNA methyltransferase [Muribaculaceae bacterium]
MKKLSVIELDRVSKEEFKTIDKTPLIVVLDNIRSLNNVGSVFRSSDAFKLEKIYLCGVTATPPNAEIHKTALGAEDSMDWEYCEDTKQVVEKLKNDGYKVFAVEQVQNSIMLDKIELDKNSRYALILGNEVKGVQQEVVDMCDFAVEIPQFGTKHSLNVSVAGGIVIWEFFKKLQF